MWRRFPVSLAREAKYHLSADVPMATSNGGWSALDFNSTILCFYDRRRNTRKLSFFPWPWSLLKKSDSSSTDQWWVDNPDLSWKWVKQRRSVSSRSEPSSIRWSTRARTIQLWWLSNRVVRENPFGKETQVNYPEGKTVCCQSSAIFEALLLI